MGWVSGWDHGRVLQAYSCPNLKGLPPNQELGDVLALVFLWSTSWYLSGQVVPGHLGMEGATGGQWCQSSFSGHLFHSHTFPMPLRLPFQHGFVVSSVYLVSASIQTSFPVLDCGLGILKAKMSTSLGLLE